MPEDIVHNLMGIALLVLCIYSMPNLGFDSSFIITFSAFYLFSLFWLSPDLDLDKGSGSLRRWGPLKFIWYPYKEIFRHRGLSHNILLGPLTRLLYFGFFFLVLFSLLKVSVRLPSITIDTFVAFVMGIWLPDLLHCVLDRLSIIKI